MTDSGAPMLTLKSLKSRTITPGTPTSTSRAFRVIVSPSCNHLATIPEFLRTAIPLRGRWRGGRNLPRSPLTAPTPGDSRGAVEPRSEARRAGPRSGARQPGSLRQRPGLEEDPRKRVKALREAGIPSEAIMRIHNPIDLDLGGRRRSRWRSPSRWLLSCCQPRQSTDPAEVAAGQLVGIVDIAGI